MSALLESIPSVLWPLLAAAGGIIVFFALWMEHGIEKEQFSNLKDLRRQEWKAKWGWRLLMVGIGLEVVIAAALVLKDSIDIDAAKNAWRNQRIYAFEATAILFVRPLKPLEDFEQLAKFPPGIDSKWIPPEFAKHSLKKEDNAVILFLGRAVDMEKVTYSRENAEVQSDEAYRSAASGLNDKSQLIRFDIHFGGHHENFFENKFGNTLDFGNDLLTPKDLDAISIVLPFRCEVIKGEIKMKIDEGLTNIVFQIPKQITFVCAATSFETNGTFLPIDFSPEIRAENK